MSPVPDSPLNSTRRVYQVGELARLLQSLLDDALPQIWLEGEISNFRNPSGHWYFALKDADAQLRCAMFRNANRLVSQAPRDGQQVLVRGRITLYAPRGDLQMIVEHMEPAGEGALRAAFEQLKRKLEAEGLFNPAQRRPIPVLPHRIAIITSASGAALHDIRTTLARRFPLVPVELIPVPVQGEAAAPAIAEALTGAVAGTGADVVILARGGGSLEDLWAFNEEIVARAIRACPAPVITGVGHETDITIADLAADLRAATPTAAAEHAVPDQRAVRDRLRQADERLHRAAGARLRSASERLAALVARLGRQSPQRQLHTGAQRTDELAQRLLRLTVSRLELRRQRVSGLAARLARRHPERAVQSLRQRLQTLDQRLGAGASRQLADRQARLRGLHARLFSCGPEQVLARGYALVSDRHGRLLRDPASVADGERLRIRLAAGELPARVDRRANAD